MGSGRGRETSQGFCKGSELKRQEIYQILMPKIEIVLRNYSSVMNILGRTVKIVLNDLHIS
jgi:hypothetical protein